MDIDPLFAMVVITCNYMNNDLNGARRRAGLFPNGWVGGEPYQIAGEIDLTRIAAGKYLNSTCDLHTFNIQCTAERMTVLEMLRLINWQEHRLPLHDRR